MNKIIRPNTGEIVPASTVDSFELVFSPAKQTLDMVRRLQPFFAWCERYRAQGNNFEPLDTHKEAWARNRNKARFWYRNIPDQTEILAKATSLFYAAEHVPAPVDWLRAALELMLASSPNSKSVSEHYTAALVDSVMDDPDVWAGYRPGFSCSVIARVIREARRSKFVLTHAEFLECCQKHRKIFKEWQWDLCRMEDLRDQAEAILINLGEVEVEPGDRDDISF
jgi:hypothetical protein